VSAKYTVSLKKLIENNSLGTIFMPRPPEEIYISSRDVHRPGLILSGYAEFFDPERVQFLGMVECSYLESRSAAERLSSLETYFSKKPSALVFTRGLSPPEGVVSAAEKYGVPLLCTGEATSTAMAAMISFLGVELAERITRHGVFVEVYGEGVLLLGESGVGKSETAVELIKRGHRLIADDAVEIRKVSSKTLVGSAPDNIRHYIEIRGIGVVNARRIFGMGAVKLTEKIDLVIQMEPWDQTKVYDRMGLDEEYAEIMGIRVPATVVPVKPGRNLAIIIEIAAMNNRQKKMGYNAARELMKSLGMLHEEPAISEIDF